jgi:hypothetical protein
LEVREEGVPPALDEPFPTLARRPRFDIGDTSPHLTVTMRQFMTFSNGLNRAGRLIKGL